MTNAYSARGTTLGPYQLESELGRGGMGIVYRATDVRLGRAVALKLVQHHVAAELGLTTTELRARLRREAQLGARISHPNVVTVYAYEEVSDDSLVAMELVDGSTLAELLASGQRWRAEDAARLLAQAADGISAAHALGIVHRDLKPGNLIVTRDGRCKVLDFGIAKLTSAAEAPQLSRTNFGTVQYMSPEQVLGRATGPSTDVWALGAIAYELVTGRTLFSRQSAITSATQITRGVRFETGAQWTQASDDAVVFAQEVGALFPFLQQALQNNASSRLPDGGAARAALLAIAGGSAPTPSVPLASVAPVVAQRRAATRPRVAILSALLIVVAFVISVSAYLLATDGLRSASGSFSVGGGSVGRVAAAEMTPLLQPPVAPAADSAAAPPPLAGTAALTTGTTHVVEMIGDGTGYRFEPSNLTIVQGDGIEFRMVSGGPHNVAFDPAALSAGATGQLIANMPEPTGLLSGKLLLTAGETYTVSFAGVPLGRYEFHCTPHLAMNMQGVVTVVADSTKK
jgi:plastocyanin